MSQALAQPYQQLKKAWESQPQDLAKCGQLLSQLKVSLINYQLFATLIYNRLKLGLIEAGLLFPQGSPNTSDLEITRAYDRAWASRIF